MNREGAETYLRLLAEAEVRGPLVPAPRPPWAAGAGESRAKMTAVAAALPGPLRSDMDFPLSVWLRDSGGRWHTGRPAGRGRPANTR